MLPLVAGLAELAWFVVAGRPADHDRADLRLPARDPGRHGGPGAGRTVADHGRPPDGSRRSPAGRPRCIAARRLADDPRAAVPGVSGLVLALFVTTVAHRRDHHDRSRTAGAGREHRGRRHADRRAARPPAPADYPGVDAVSPVLLAELRRVPGVRGVTVLHRPAGPPRPGEAGIATCAGPGRDAGARPLRPRRRGRPASTRRTPAARLPVRPRHDVAGGDTAAGPGAGAPRRLAGGRDRRLARRRSSGPAPCSSASHRS